MAPSLKELVSKRAQIKGKLTRFNNFLSNFNSDEDNYSEIKVRLNKIKDCWSDFEYIQDKIEMLDLEDGCEDRQLTAREDFESNYFKIVGEAESYLFKHTLQTCSQSSNDKGGKGMSVKLPDISLPTFSGDVKSWPSFKDLFISLINNNEELSDVQRFYYLRASLRGDALEAVESMELTAGNFTVAWNLLNDRYQNERLSVETHISALFDQPKIERESGVALRQLLNNSLKHIRALGALKQPVTTWDAILIYIITSKFDDFTFKDWRNETKGGNLPTFATLERYMVNRCEVLESVVKNKASVIKSNSIRSSSATFPVKPAYKNSMISKTRPASYVASHQISDKKGESEVNQTVKCPICPGSHAIFYCKQFLSLSCQQRADKIRALRLCLNCLRPNHQVRDCKNLGSCRVCQAKHNTLIHSDQFNNTLNSSNTPAVISWENKANSSSATVSHAIYDGNNVVLSTALVNVRSFNGQLIPCRALLDSGSQVNIMSEAMCQRLKLKKYINSVSISGINSLTSSASHVATTAISSRVQNFTSSLTFVILPKLTELIPSVKINTSDIHIPTNITLADPSCFTPNRIDMILGNEVFWDLINSGRIVISNNDSPILQETVLGWIIAGRLPKQISQPQIGVYSLTSLQDVSKQIEKFWEIENVNESVQTGEDMECENHYKSTVSRTNTGRYIVHLPTKNLSRLGSSKELAIRRFFNLEKRFVRNPSMHETYRNFIEEYIQLGHMVQISEDEIRNTHSYFLPHHCVIKQDSTTTALRVVFDASAPTSTSVSLNDCLKLGPVVQDDLFSILVRFRKHLTVMTADIAKMYRQVLITTEQTPLQLIVWRDKSGDDLKIYKLLTVTYGTKSAPWLATRTLKQLSLDENSNYTLAADILSSDFYIDDCLTGSDDLETALEIQRQLINLLRSGGFHLRKWTSNNLKLLESLPREDVEPRGFHNFDDSDLAIKTLGIYWNPKGDTFQYSVNLKSLKIHSKRTILSEISSIFDPLGMIGPIMLRAKSIMQEIWLLKIDWDDAIPTPILNNWLSLRDTFQYLNNLRIPRLIRAPGEVVNIQLHGFSDASELGYGACIYLRSVNSWNQINVKLLCSKSRVSPIKRQSLPRLELCAAVLLAELVQRTERALKIEFHSKTFWSDSTIVLSWLSACVTNWNTFVANRVSRIQSLTEVSNWRHVDGTDNPADIVSRGASAKDLLDSSIWWDGPHFLYQSPSWEFPSNINFFEVTDLPDLKGKILVHTLTADLSIIQNYSSYTKLIRVIALCIRFKHNALHPKENRRYNSLNRSELAASLQAVVRLVQRKWFPEEYKSLKNDLPLKVKSRLLQLHPFLDSNDIIRVGGRLQNSNLTSDIKHPMVLPNSGHFTKLLISHEHNRLCHAGCQATLNSIRQRFWPLSGRSVTRQVIRRCVTCFRVKPQGIQQLMGNLPKQRTTPSRPFMHTGLDYCGPIQLLPYRRRGISPVKAYIALFVCFSTRAIHLELIEDLTADAFLAGLTRFISRRGKCDSLWSDNATTFVGANNNLRDLHTNFNTNNFQSRLSSYFSSEGINWHFIPPRSPHFGGLWEAGVKSVKYHLNRILGNTVLTYSEYYTVLCKVEACLNSRPITPLSNDPSDFTALTPSHFLIGGLLTELPEQDLADIPVNRLSRWQHINQLQQHFWRRWQRDFICQLQERVKWKRTSKNLDVGTLVLIREDNVPPLHWCLGRVTSVHPGRDGIVRTATIQTSNGSYQRAITKLCPLPIEDEAFERETQLFQGGRDVGSEDGNV